MLRSGRTNVPVTALAFAGYSVVISGQGPFLHAYCTAGIKHTATVQAFDDQAVHGVVICSHSSPTRGIAYGGQRLRLFHYSHNSPNQDERFELAETFQATDWILDAAISPDDEGNSERIVGLVTAHNALLIATARELECKETSQRKRILVPVVPGSNLLLYSAHIRWLSASQCLIASGTALGDVVIWSAILTRDDVGEITAHCHSYFTFPAHDGSVFGVQISPVLFIDDSPQRVLVTCSDDRSVRVWDVSDVTTFVVSPIQHHQDTVFGASSTAGHLAAPHLATAMGHISRVWHVKFLPFTRSTDAQLQFMSFGEDTSRVTWILRRNPVDGTFALEKQQVVAAHAGKHVWSSAISPSGAVVTGGADGSIAVHLPSPKSPSRLEISGPLLRHDTGRLKAYSCVDEDTLVSITEEGKIVTAELNLPTTTRVSEVSPPLPGLQGFSLTACVSGIAFVVGTHGIVYAYVHKSRLVHELCTLKSHKPAGLFAAKAFHCEGDDAIVLLVTFVGSQTATVLRISTELLAEHFSAQTQLRQERLQLSQGYIVTSFSPFRETRKPMVVTGARNGEIVVHEWVEDASDTNSASYVTILRITSTREAVTALRWVHETDDCRTESGHLHSTSRDATYTIHHIHRTPIGWMADMVHKLPLPFGPNIEGFSGTLNQRILAWGFRSKQFVAHDIISQQDVMVVDCGGAHRTWHFRPRQNGGTFVWTKASRVYCQSQEALPYGLINPGGHGREIKVVAVSSIRHELFATGAEDTNIKLWALEHGIFKCLHTLRKHNTGIQHLEWSANGRFLFSSGGFEEFFVWKVTDEVPYIGVGVLCESEHPQSGRSDLRVMHFSILSQEGGQFDILMAYSDSALKKWRYCSAGQTWQLLCEAKYLTSCLTHVMYLRHMPGFVTAANDGHLTFWPFDVRDDKEQMLWETRHQIHQNAILSIVSHTLPNGSTLLITGGDDNALAITHLLAREWASPKELLVPRAHAAAITSLAIVAPFSPSSSDLFLASASLDQRIKVWRISFNSFVDINVECIANVSTAVADVAGLAVTQVTLDSREVRGLVVCGVGLEHWTLQVPRRCSR